MLLRSWLLVEHPAIGSASPTTRPCKHGSTGSSTRPANRKSKLSEKDLKAAKKARKQAFDYGKGKYKEARKAAADGEWLDALETISQLEKIFKGHEVGDRSKKLHDEWKKDKRVKLEISGSKILAKAELLAKNGKYKLAYQYAAKLARTTKYDGTSVQEKAAELAKLYRRKI